MNSRLNLTPLLDLLLVILFAALLQAASQFELQTERERGDREAAEEEAEAVQSLQDDLREQNAKLLEQNARLTTRLESAMKDLIEARESSTAEVRRVENQRERVELALEGLVADIIASASESDAELVSSVVAAAQESMDPAQLAAALDSTEDLRKSATEALTRKVMQSMAFERVCDLWEIRFESNRRIALWFAGEELGARPFEPGATPAASLIEFLIEEVRAARSTSNRPAVIWVEYAGDEPLLRVTKKFFLELKGPLIADLRAEFQSQNVIVADQL